MQNVYGPSSSCFKVRFHSRYWRSANVQSRRGVSTDLLFSAAQRRCPPFTSQFSFISLYWCVEHSRLELCFSTRCWVKTLAQNLLRKALFSVQLTLPSKVDFSCVRVRQKFVCLSLYLQTISMGFGRHVAHGQSAQRRRLGISRRSSFNVFQHQ